MTELTSGTDQPEQQPKLLSGGNPQIPKGEGEGPVRAYIEAMPGWKREVGEQLDQIVCGAVPEVVKAVKWNSPFYGIESNGWFMSFHCLTKYVKVSFFSGNSLVPIPPIASKVEGPRYLHIHQGDVVDREQLADWFGQAAALPGWTP